MSEQRTDWLIGRTVLVAEHRAARPNEFEGRPFTTSPAAVSDGPNDPGTRPRRAAAESCGVSTCPFCPGQEHRTPPAVHAFVNDQGQWQVRVVPNKYPAVEPPFDEDLRRYAAEAAISRAAGCDESPAAADTSVPVVHVTTPAAGVHEVVIESAPHLERMSLLPVENLLQVLESYAARLRHWRSTGELQYGLVFKNQGPQAGASLSHLHSQLVALPEVPLLVAAEGRRAERAYRSYRACPYCRLVEHELSDSVRVVYQQDGYLAVCPFASLQPYEVWLMPVTHQPSFEDLSSAQLASLAGVLHWLLVRLEAVVLDGAYNMALRTAPWQGLGDAWQHWRIELLPRSTSFAGLELAAGLFINPVAPERAAVKLRSNELFSLHGTKL